MARGTIIAKPVWKNIKHPNWEAAIVPGKLIHTEITIKNSRKYKATGGWDFARWKGMELKPYVKNKTFCQECLACHANGRGYILTVLT